MKKIVVLGGGYGGMRVIKNLLNEDLGEMEITLVDRNNYHSLKTEFYALAAGTIADTHVRVNFPEDDRLRKVYGHIDGIDLEAKKVRMLNMDAIEYDYLVIALGCEDNYHGIEGAAQYTHGLQTIKKARATYSAICNLDPYQGIIVLGGGLSGIEIASEVRESRPDINIKLLERGDSVLKPFDNKIREYAENWFKEHDVEVIHRANIDRVVERAVYSNGNRINGDVIIWTAGVRPNRITRELGVEKDKQDRVVVNEYYQIPEYRNVFVVGDCASSSHSPSAQLAQQQGDKVVEILFALLNGEEPKVPAPLQLKGTLGSLGKHDGFGNMFNMPFTGFLPRMAKSGVLWLHKRH